LNHLIEKSAFASIYSYEKYTDFSSVMLPKEINIRMIKDIVIVLRVLFENVKNIPFKKKEPSKVFLEFLKEENYELIGEYRKCLVSILDDNCGKTFITIADSINKGWRCPYCDLAKTDEEIFLKLVHHIRNQEYTTKESFEAWNKKMHFIHIPCNNIMYESPHRFLHGYRLCNCLSTVKRKATRSSKKHSHKITHEIATKRIKDLVGKEYILLGDFKNSYSDKIELLHSKCNRTIKMTLKSFFKGKRCKHCNERISKKEFKKLVIEKSNGRYECKSFDRHRVTIIDTTNGKETILTRARVLQELCRPTPSDILPLSEPETI